MRLSGLAARLRGYGFDVVEHRGWATRGYRGRDLSAVRGVAWHHTGTPRRAGQSDYPTANYIMTGGAYAPWAHLGIGTTGRVHMLAAGLANHAGRGSYPGLRGNSDLIGVEVETPGTAASLTDAQKATIRALARALTVIYGLDAQRHHIRHLDWAPSRKVDLAGMTTTAIRAAAADPASLGGAPTPAPEPEDDDMSDAQYTALRAQQDAILAALTTLTAGVTAAERAAVTARDQAAQARGQAALAVDQAAQARGNSALAASEAAAARGHAVVAAEKATATNTAVGRLASTGAPAGTVKIDPTALEAAVAKVLRERDTRAAGTAT